MSILTTSAFYSNKSTPKTIPQFYGRALGYLLHTCKSSYFLLVPPRTRTRNSIKMKMDNTTQHSMAWYVVLRSQDIYAVYYLFLCWFPFPLIHFLMETWKSTRGPKVGLVLLDLHNLLLMPSRKYLNRTCRGPAVM